MCCACCHAVAAALDASGCEKMSVKSSGDKPIAVVWHVFRPQDADRIRSFVDKVSLPFVCCAKFASISENWYFAK